mmetsp:Transcript_7174/g.21025  ORF Transcript_7174/g.21025 Transcript_7174/m.21025 type:complete len:257 (+) Transcript_7174:218-988(+)
MVSSFSHAASASSMSAKSDSSVSASFVWRMASRSCATVRTSSRPRTSSTNFTLASRFATMTIWTLFRNVADGRRVGVDGPRCGDVAGAAAAARRAFRASLSSRTARARTSTSSEGARRRPRFTALCKFTLANCALARTWKSARRRADEPSEGGSVSTGHGVGDPASHVACAASAPAADVRFAASRSRSASKKATSSGDRACARSASAPATPSEWSARYVFASKAPRPPTRDMIAMPQAQTSIFSVYTPVKISSGDA